MRFGFADRLADNPRKLATTHAAKLAVCVTAARISVIRIIWV